MHTFFVNTSDKLDISTHMPLLDSLLADKKLIVLQYGLDRLLECADRIAEIITRDTDIPEKYNLIVYTNIEERNEVALANEMAIAIKIEENLLARLYDKGRQAYGTLVIFGENFDRGAEYGEGKKTRLNVENAIWKTFPICCVEEAVARIKDVKKIYNFVDDANLEVYKSAFAEALLSDKSETAVLDEGSEFVEQVIFCLADLLKEQDSISAAELRQLLYTTIINQRDYAMGRIAVEQVQYAHARFRDSDINATSKSICRILMFVYQCAVCEEFIFADATEDFNINGDEGLTSDCSDDERIIVLGKNAISDVDWKYFAAKLEKYRQILEKENQLIDIYETKFPKFCEKYLDDSGLIAPSMERPRLAAKIKAKMGMTMDALHEAVDATFKEVEEKNAENEERINNYITIITDDFNSSKDSQMGQIVYKELPENNIKNNKLTEEFIRKQKDRINAEIADKKRLTMAATHVEDLIKESRDRINYWFDCMNKGLLVWIVGLVFLALFAIPYAYIQREIFEKMSGIVIYIVSVLAFAGIYVLGYFLFRLLFTFRIVKELQVLCNKFAETQKEKEQCMDNYKDLICRVIPLSFCLTLYENEFMVYKNESAIKSTHVTYHKKQLQTYLNYIKLLYENLAINYHEKSSDSLRDYTSQIVLEADKYSNNSVYLLLDAEHIQDYFIK